MNYSNSNPQTDLEKLKVLAYSNTPPTNIVLLQHWLDKASTPILKKYLNEWINQLNGGAIVSDVTYDEAVAEIKKQKSGIPAFATGGTVGSIKEYFESIDLSRLPETAQVFIKEQLMNPPADLKFDNPEFLRIRGLIDELIKPQARIEEAVAVEVPERTVVVSPPVTEVTNVVENKPSLEEVVAAAKKAQEKSKSTLYIYKHPATGLIYFTDSQVDGDEELEVLPYEIEATVEEELPAVEENDEASAIAEINGELENILPALEFVEGEDKVELEEKIQSLRDALSILGGTEKHEKGGKVAPWLKKFNKALYEALGKLLKAYIENGGTLEYSDTDYGYLNDALDLLAVKYFGEEPDGDYQEELASDGSPDLTDIEAFVELVTRFKNTRIDFDDLKFETGKSSIKDVNKELYTSLKLLSDNKEHLSEGVSSEVTATIAGYSEKNEEDQYNSIIKVFEDLYDNDLSKKKKHEKGGHTKEQYGVIRYRITRQLTDAEMSYLTSRGVDVDEEDVVDPDPNVESVIKIESNLGVIEKSISELEAIFKDALGNKKEYKGTVVESAVMDLRGEKYQKGGGISEFNYTKPFSFAEIEKFIHDKFSDEIRLVLYYDVDKYHSYINVTPAKAKKLIFTIGSVQKQIEVESQGGMLYVELTLVDEKTKNAYVLRFIAAKDREKLKSAVSDIIAQFKKGGAIGGSPQREMDKTALSMLVEYSAKLFELKGKTPLPAWADAKISKAEFTVAAVKHNLESKHPELFAAGGELNASQYAKMQLKHINKYSKSLLQHFDKLEFEAWMSSLLFVAADYLDGIFHYLDYTQSPKLKDGGKVDPGVWHFVLRTRIPSTYSSSEYQYMVEFTSPSGKRYASFDTWTAYKDSAREAKVDIMNRLMETGAIDALVNDEILSDSNGNPYFVLSEDNRYATGGGMGYKDAVSDFNKELLVHPMVIKASQHYGKTPDEVVKALQTRISTKGNRAGNTKEVYIDFTDKDSGIVVKHKKKYSNGGGLEQPTEYAKVEDLKIGNIVRFIKKSDKDDVTNGKILDIDTNESRVWFIDTDYPSVGRCNFTFYSLNKHYLIEIIKPKYDNRSAAKRAMDKLWATGEYDELGIQLESEFNKEKGSYSHGGPTGSKKKLDWRVGKGLGAINYHYGFNNGIIYVTDQHNLSPTTKAIKDIELVFRAKASSFISEAHKLAFIAEMVKIFPELTKAEIEEALIFADKD